MVYLHFPSLESVPNQKDEPNNCETSIYRKSKDCSVQQNVEVKSRKIENRPEEFQLPNLEWILISHSDEDILDFSRISYFFLLYLLFS